MGEKCFGSRVNTTLTFFCDNSTFSPCRLCEPCHMSLIIEPSPIIGPNLRWFASTSPHVHRADLRQMTFVGDINITPLVQPPPSLNPRPLRLILASSRPVPSRPYLLLPSRPLPSSSFISSSHSKPLSHHPSLSNPTHPIAIMSNETGVEYVHWPSLMRIQYAYGRVPFSVSSRAGASC